MAAPTLLLFGATGDLARRMLLPSLRALHDEGLLEDLRIVATARSELDDAGYRAMAAAALAEHGGGGDPASFLERLTYQPLDVTEAAHFEALAKKVGEAADLAIFLSTAPQLFEPTIAGLSGAGLAHEGVRIGLEKPLGSDLASSCRINDAVSAAFSEDRIFRVDHYLGKETVQNLLALRFANMMFEPLWNAVGIDHIQITVSETVGLEGRTDYYDGAGALRDMVQNHMLQLVALIAMEPPTAFDATAVRDEKVKVVRALRPLDAADVARGQYEAGRSGSESVPGYADELGRASATETFVALKVHVDNWRWQGVPFYLRTGKRLAERRSEIVVQFKCVPHSIFESRGAALTANRLVIRLQPEEYVRLKVMAKEPGLDRDGIHLREVALDLSLSAAFAGERRRIAYERLLLDLIDGEQTLFVRRDEVEAQWRWIDAIRAGWGKRAPDAYEAGSWGPSLGIDLIERDGRHWND